MASTEEPQCSVCVARKVRTKRLDKTCKHGVYEKGVGDLIDIAPSEIDL